MNLSQKILVPTAVEHIFIIKKLYLNFAIVVWFCLAFVWPSCQKLNNLGHKYMVGITSDLATGNVWL